MARLPFVSRDQFPEQLTYVWDRLDAAGMPPNIFRVMGNNPALLRNYLRLGNSLWSDIGLDVATRELAILRSDGGLQAAQGAIDAPVTMLLSGPAGGVTGAVWVAEQCGYRDLITFDMGGTSTDVALVQDLTPRIGRETKVGDLTVRASSVDVRTVGAGGGSIAHVPELTRALRVGPQSAGADPGPAAYGKGGTEPTVTDANVILDTNVIEASGSTVIVLFPGTRGTMKNNRIWRNELSGLFVWGGTVTSEGDEYDANEEHAIEMRAYPDPLLYPEIPSSQRIRAVGVINNNTIKNTVVLPETGTLGGGFLAQGANADVTNSRIFGNRGIGVSYVNTSLGRVIGNEIYDNRGSAICIFRAGNVSASGNVIRNNARDAVGVCYETTP